VSHGENVPSDWYSSRYREHCELCGATYHASEGGCSCCDDLDDCACGKNEWARRVGVFLVDDEAPIRCECCGTEPGTTPEPAARLLCSWCGAVMREGVEPASHGICPACEAKFDPAT